MKVVKFKIICSNEDRPEHFVLHPSISADMLTDGEKTYFSTLNDVDLTEEEFLKQERYAMQPFTVIIDCMLRGRPVSSQHRHSFISRRGGSFCHDAQSLFHEVKVRPKVIAYIVFIYVFLFHPCLPPL